MKGGYPFFGFFLLNLTLNSFSAWLKTYYL